MSLAVRGRWSTHNRCPRHGFDCGVPLDQRTALTDSRNHALPQPTSLSPSSSELTARTATPPPPPRRRRPRLPRHSKPCRYTLLRFASLRSKREMTSLLASRAPCKSSQTFRRPSRIMHGFALCFTHSTPGRASKLLRREACLYILIPCPSRISLSFFVVNHG